jgi:leucyl/phenylalanyl-tRNA--protein transferase
MFNRIDNGAKFALIALQQHLQRYAPGWIDCQLPNPFLMRLGATVLPRHDYLPLLTGLSSQAAPPGHWRPQPLVLE